MKQLLLIALLIVSLVNSQDVTQYCTSYASGCPTEYDNDFGGTSTTPCEDYWNALLAADPNWLGTLDTTIANTIGCRQYQIETVGICAAGTTTTDVCVGATGGICENYCDFVMSWCYEDTTFQYYDYNSCITWCAILATASTPFPELLGTAGDTFGPSINCRNYHAIAAGRLGTEHCDHAGITGAGICGSLEEAFFVTRVLTLDPVLDINIILQENFTVNTVDEGTIDDHGADNLGCRVYHSGVAWREYLAGNTSEGDYHWAHGSYHGGDVCGDYCTVYCRIMSQQCGRQETIDQCMSQCFTHPFLGDAGTLSFVDLPTTDGDSIECRLYHVGVDMWAPKSDMHCTHASFSGAGVCGDLCENYCSRFASADFTTCGDSTSAQYQDYNGCMAICGSGAWVPGAFEETSGNSQNCRMYHLGVSLTYADSLVTADIADWNAHCSHAGFSGGNVCGDYCENYCTYIGACPPNSAVQFQIPTGAVGSAAECMSACSVMDNTGDDSATGGASVQCRIYHATAGFQFFAGGDTTGLATHCPHAGFSSESDVCGTVCENMCQFQQNTCGDLPNFQTQPDCLNLCDSFTPGTIDETSGNSAACRLYHVQVAALSDTEDLRIAHCGHSNNDGGEVCGTPCEAYCGLQFAFCPTNFANAGACMQACGNYSTNATLGDTSGDSLQCRLYHLIVAANSATTADIALHCSHSDETGSGVCVAPVTEDTSAGTGTDATGTDATEDTGNDTGFSVKVICSFVLFALALMI